MKYKITVFTPAYKCAHTIHRVWESLQKQTFRDFEWIIVNDCSPDNTQEIIEGYQKQADFPVTIFKHTENLGKHFAWNLAAEKAEGELFVPADADDTFVPHTLEYFAQKWDEIEESEKANYSGLNVLCKIVESNQIIGNPYPESPLITNNLELSYKYHIKGEKWGVLRTDLMKKYKFPELKSKAGFFPENYLWFTLAKEGYLVICYNEPLRTYFTDDQDSLVHRDEDLNRTALTSYTYLSWHLNNFSAYMFKTMHLKRWLHYVLDLYRNGLFMKQSFWKIINSANSTILKFAYAIFALPSYFYYLIKK